MAKSSKRFVVFNYSWKQQNFLYIGKEKYIFEETLDSPSAHSVQWLECSSEIGNDEWILQNKGKKMETNLRVPYFRYFTEDFPSLDVT